MLINKRYNALLVNELKSTGSSKSQIADTVKDIKLALCSFPEVSFQKINRSANGVADGLAKLCYNALCGGVLLGQAPSCVREMIQIDCNSVISVDG